MNTYKDTLPRLGKLLLWLFLDDGDYYQAVGDFEETCRYKVQTEGRAKANLWFWFLLFKSLPGFISDSIYWRGVMIKNYLKIAWRNIKRHKGYSFINITGLAVGITCCLLITLWIRDELSLAGSIKMLTTFIMFLPIPMSETIQRHRHYSHLRLKKNSLKWLKPRGITGCFKTH